MDFEKIAGLIIENIGGKTNVDSIDHCATRLRIKLIDKSLLNADNIRVIDGVLGVEEKNGVIHIVIGDKVADVYKAMDLNHKVRSNDEVVYNRAKVWQIGMFALNNSSTNIWMFVMNFVSYYAVGVAGLLTAVVGFLLTAMRIFDGITDPIIGMFIDKTDGKFGKFRPFMIAGNIICAVMTGVIFYTTHLVPSSFRLLYFILCYAIYIIGYTFQTACTKAGQSCLTNDPSQRPIFSMFDGVFIIILFMGLQIIISGKLVPMAGGMNAKFFSMLHTMGLVLSAILCLCAVIGIWSHDRTEFFGTGQQTEKVKLRDYVTLIKENRPLQMLIVAASTDKLSGSMMQNSIMGVVMFGILVGDYSLSGSISAITMIPTLVLGLLLMNLSRKTGLKKAMVVSSWVAIILVVINAVFLFAADLTQISLKSIGLITILHIVISILRGAVTNVSSNIVIPMIADCTDYYTYKTGKYLPGMIGTTFSFVDKLISSLASTVVTLGLAMIGFTTTLPQVGDAPTMALKVFYIVMFCGAPLLGLIANVIAMKFYELDKERMAEIQSAISERKQAA